MGRASRRNLRSRDGGKPRAFCALHRLWRAVQYFGEDRAAFDRWVESKSLKDAERAWLERLWVEQHPQPLVTIAHG